MTLLPALLSGFSNIFGAIPYKFPVSTEVIGLGVLSDALVCRLKWDSPRVLRERDLLLKTPSKASARFIREWRRKAMVAATEAFQIMKGEEMRIFGERSYFYNLEELQKYRTPFPDYSTDTDEEADAEGARIDRVAEAGYKTGAEEEDAEEDTEEDDEGSCSVEESLYMEE
jgi:hypothetical protein